LYVFVLDRSSFKEWKKQNKKGWIRVLFVFSFFILAVAFERSMYRYSMEREQISKGQSHEIDALHY